MCPTTYQRPPTSRWLTSGLSSTSSCPSSRFWSTHTWTLSGHSPKFCLLDKVLRNRNDEDREINHHGRPVEVGEAESSPANGVIKVISNIIWIGVLSRDILLFFPSLPRFLRKIWLLWTRRFNWRHYKVSIAGEISYDIYNYNQSLITFISLSNIESILTTNTRSDKKFQGYIKLLNFLPQNEVEFCLVFLFNLLYIWATINQCETLTSNIKHLKIKIWISGWTEKTRRRNTWRDVKGIKCELSVI